MKRESRRRRRKRNRKGVARGEGGKKIKKKKIGKCVDLKKYDGTLRIH